jgi:hypothetical protein
MVQLVRKITVALLVAIWLWPGATPARAASAQLGPPTQPAPAAAEQPRRVAAPGQPVPGTAAEIERLAERERQATLLQKFQGGGSIGTTTIIVILLLVIILVLIIR